MLKQFILCAFALLASMALASPSVQSMGQACAEILQANHQILNPIAFSRLDWSTLPEQANRHTEKMRQLVEDIENNSAPPDFANTIQAIDEFFGMPASMRFLFYAQVNTQPTVEVAEEYLAKLEKLQAETLLNQKLFARVEAVYSQRLPLNLSPEQLRLTELVFEKFIRAGVRLDEKKRRRLVEIREQLSFETRN